MKIENKKLTLEQAQNSQKDYSSKLKNFCALSFNPYFSLFGFLFLVTCFSHAFAATPQKEQLDPVDALLYSLDSDSNSTNKETIHISNKPQQPDSSSRTWQPPTLTINGKLPLWQESVEFSTISGINFASTADSDQIENNSSISKNSGTGYLKQNSQDFENQLQQARIQPLKKKEGSKSKEQLEQLVNRVRSIKFNSKNSEPVIVVEPVPENEPNKTSFNLNLIQESETKDIILNLPSRRGPVTTKTLQIIDDLSSQPEQLPSPFELAEVLYRSGCLKEAAVCYRQALEKTPADKEDLTQRRAWILFQIGNCLRNNDRPGAMQIYKQLITEYPNSTWVGMAQAWCRLINWYQEDKPEILVSDEDIINLIEIDQKMEYPTSE